MTTVLSIAGSDPSGGAGIQADLQVFASLGVHGAAAVTALTVQDTVGVREVWPCPADLVRRQVAAVLADLRPAAIKVGMVGSAEVVEAAAEALAERGGAPLVVDPIRSAGSGDALTDDAGFAALRELLLPIATVITPNATEAEALAGIPVRTLAEAKRAARELAKRGCAVLVKGGHLEGDPVDVLCVGEECAELPGERIALAQRVHGTGCALSAALAVYLAEGCELHEACVRAKAYVAAGLRQARVIGRGALVIDYAAAGTGRMG